MDVGLFYILLEEQRKTEVKFGIVNVIVVMKKILMVIFYAQDNLVPADVCRKKR